MIILKLLIAILLSTGVLLFFNIEFWHKEKKMTFSFKRASAKSKRVKINAETTLSKFEKAHIRLETLIKKLGKSFSYFYIFLAVCFLIGNVVGYIFFKNGLLMFIMGLAFMPMTYLYLIFRTQEITREELAELQNNMSIITNSYMANNDILRSVELFIAERNRYQDGGIKKVTPFEEFVSDCLYINPNVERGLDQLAVKINNKYFDQWVKNLRLCLGDKQMRFALQPVIDAMADEKIMQIESDTQMRKTWFYYLSMVGVMLAVIPSLRIARIEWFLLLTQTTTGQLIIIMMIISALLGSIYVMKINKPIGEV